MTKFISDLVLKFEAANEYIKLLAGFLSIILVILYITIVAAAIVLLIALVIWVM